MYVERTKYVERIVYVERILYSYTWYNICTLSVGQLPTQSLRFLNIDARCPLTLCLGNAFQESESEKRDRLLLELSDDTKTQKKKPWYGFF